MLNIVICDDLKTDRDRLEALVSKYLTDKGLTAELHVFDHPDTCLTACEKLQPEIILLDIVMPMITGIQAARELRWNKADAQIIFTTSEKSFALEAFDVNPLQYLVKPVDEEKLRATLDLAVKNCSGKDSARILVKNKAGVTALRLRDVCYIDYRSHVVSYHLYDKSVVSTSTLRIGFSEYLEGTITDAKLVRCHESIAVNIAAVDRLSKTELLLRSKEVIPVSKSCYAAVADAYLNYHMED